MSEKMIVSVSPHIRSNISTTKIMGNVLVALLPALVTAVMFFGIRSLAVVVICVCSAVISEWAFEKITGKESTISDQSAVVTGVLLAYNLPVSIPLWQAAFGSIVAIVVVKQLFGGTGQNFANPAITARIILMLAFPTAMTTWITADAVTGATPLALISGGNIEALPSMMDMFLGKCGGSLGETSVIALLIGFVYLLATRTISWHTPVVFIGTVFVLTALLGEQPEYQIMSGGLMLGAIFMATDYSSTPSTKWGQVIFGLGCGVITVLIRVWGNYPEGVSFSILLMNILTPHISNWTRAKPLGAIEKGAN